MVQGTVGAALGGNILVSAWWFRTYLRCTDAISSKVFFLIKKSPLAEKIEFIVERRDFLYFNK